MCGLFGAISGTLGKTDLHRVQMLGILSQFRGTDSTGIAVASRHGTKKRGRDPLINYYTMKDTTDSSGFFYNPETNKRIESINGSVCAIIGHCRQATAGHVTKENAHPYALSNLIGAHNGTIKHLAPKEEDAENTTDSLNLYKKISKDGIAEVVKEMRDGAYALTWFDTEDDHLHLVRNDQRPLSILHHKPNNTIYWASDMRFPSFMAAMEGMTEYEITQLKPYELYTFNIGEGIGFHKEELEKPAPFMEITHPRRPFVNYDNGCGHGQWWEDNHHHHQHEKLKETVLSLPKPSASTTSGPTVLLKPNGEVIPLSSAAKSQLADYDEKNTYRCTDVGSPKELTPVSKIFPKPVLKYGETMRYHHKIINKEGMPKFLRATLFEGGLEHPYSEAFRKLMGEGCVLTGVIADINVDPIIWLSPTEYVLAKHYADPMITECFGERNGVVCKLYYATMHKIHEVNREVQANKKKVVVH